MRRSLIIHTLLVFLTCSAAGCGWNASTDNATGTPENKQTDGNATPTVTPDGTPVPNQAADAQAAAVVQAAAAPRPSGPIEFTDVTAQAGVRFKHNSGAFGKKYMPETMGSGGAFLDYDNDGWQDILLINSKNWPEHPGAKSFPALYHNNQDGTFTNATRAAGLAVEMYGLGCAIADYDNDGNVDIYITALGPDKLFRNTGGGSSRT